MKILFKGATIITCNKDFAIINNGMLGVKNKEIVYVGEYSSEFEKEFDADSLIHANNKVLMPGLVNAHTHLPMTLFRGYGSDLPLNEWLSEKMLPAEEKLTDEDCEIGGKIGIAEMLLSGTTTFLDMYMHMHVTAKIVEETGIRAVLSRGIVLAEDQEKYFQENKDLIENFTGIGEGRVKTMVGVHAEYTNSEETIKRAIELAKKYETKINIHLSETQKEVDDCIKRTGLTPVEQLEKLGLFEVGVVAAHCVAVNNKDINILKNNNVNVAYNPSSNAKLSSGFAPIKKLLDAGVNVAIGTDGAASNNNLDMLEEMHIGSLFAKCSSADPTVMNAEQTIKMATINGAKALGLEHIIGSLERGKRADIIMFNQNSPFFLPKIEVCNNIVYSASRNELEMTMVDGKILMERGQLIKLDYAKLAGDFEKSVARLTS